MNEDYGTFRARALFFGGPYGNRQALIALREQAASLGVPPGQIVCTGDLVAYCAGAEESVRFVREWGIHVIAGNVELQLADGEDHCGCNYREGSLCDALSSRWFAYSKSALSGESVDWMRTLPQTARCRIAGKRVLVVHGTVSQTSRFVFESTPWALKRAELAEHDADVIVAGHCGIPFAQSVDGKAWANPGSLGMPANDGTPRVWYGLAEESGKGGLRFRVLPLGYDHAAAAAELLAAGLPAEHGRALISGLWCSEDVLPPEERARRGRPLHAISVSV